LSEEHKEFSPPAPRPRKSRKQAVTNYLLIMFIAAFVLLLLSFFMQQRSSEETIDGLKRSMSSMQSAQQVYEKNLSLTQKIADLNLSISQLSTQIKSMQTENTALTQQLAQLQQELDELTRATQALDWFWQINEAYVRNRHTLARELIETMGSELAQYLPKESITNNYRFSPYDRYLEIYDALY